MMFTISRSHEPGRLTPSAKWVAIVFHEAFEGVWYVACFGLFLDKDV